MEKDTDYKSAPSHEERHGLQIRAIAWKKTRIANPRYRMKKDTDYKSAPSHGERHRLQIRAISGRPFFRQDTKKPL
jgi:hypothetical protein